MRHFLLAGFALVSVASADNLDRGLHAMVAGDYLTAESELAQAVRERPADPIARFNHASALRELGKNDEAVCEYQAALSVPSDRATRADTLYGLALTRDAERDPVAATQAWQDYLAFASDQPNEAPAAEVARENLARARREASIPRVVR